MNLKKMGIKVLLVTILGLLIMKYTNIDGYVKIALGVFGIGTGVLLVMLEKYSHFD